VASCCFDLDATKGDSYTSGQKWLNLVSSPADGESQTTYDFFLGEDGSSSTDDPTYTGTVGDSASYWAFDGGDFFKLAGSNTTLLQSLHKTTGGSDWWMAIAYYKPSAAPSMWLGGTESNLPSEGVQLFDNGTESIRLLQRGSGGSSNVEVVPAGTILEDAPGLLMVSHSHSTNVTRSWYNTSTGTDTAQTFTASTANPVYDYNIMARNSVSAAPNGTRLYSYALGNGFLDDTGAAAIKSALETRHGRTY
jgi:hypothetical protein